MLRRHLLRSRHRSRSPGSNKGRSSRSRGIREAWGNPALRRLLLAFAAQNLAETAFFIALAIHVFKSSGTLALGLVGFRYLPAAVCGVVFGPLIDRLLGRRPLTRVVSVRTVLLAVAAVCVGAGAAIIVVLVLVAVDAVVAGPYRPAQSRLLPSLARTPTELSAAAASVSIVKSLSQATGGLLGGVLVAVASPQLVMAGATVVMAIAGMLSRALEPREVEAGPAVAVAPFRAGEAVRAGVAAVPRVLRHPEASPLVVLSGLRTLVRGMWSVLAVVAALDLLGLGASGVGVLQLAVGAGAIAAVPITILLIGRPRLAAPCLVAFIGAGLPLALVGLVDLRLVAFTLVVTWGACMAVSDAASMSLLHRLLDGPTIADTVNVMEAFKVAAEGAGALVAVSLVAHAGIHTALVIAGLVLPVVIVVVSSQVRRADRAAGGRARIVSLLHGVGELHPLDMASLEQVAAGVSRLDVVPGDAVIREGEPGNDFYVIEAGAVEVIVGGYHVGRLGPGAGFGERALLRNTLRSATVTALDPLSLLVVERVDFLAAITGESTAELLATDPDRGADPSSYSLPEIFARLAVFHGVGRPGLDRLAGLATIERWPPGAVLLREGDEGDTVHVVLSGRARALVAGRPVAELRAGDSFGEIAVLHGVPRQATVVAEEALTTCTLRGDDVVAARERWDERS